MSKHNIEKILLEYKKFTNAGRDIMIEDVDNIVRYAEENAGNEKGSFLAKCNPRTIAYTGFKVGYVCAMKRMKADRRREKSEYAEKIIKYNSEKEKLLEEYKDLPAQELAIKLTELTKKYYR